MTAEFEMHRVEEGVYTCNINGVTSWVCEHDANASTLELPGGYRRSRGWAPPDELFVWDEVDGGRSPQYLRPLRGDDGVCLDRHNKATGRVSYAGWIERPKGVPVDFWITLPTDHVGGSTTEWVLALFVWDEEG